MAVDGIGTVVSVLSGRVSKYTTCDVLSAPGVLQFQVNKSLVIQVNLTLDNDMQVNFQIQYQLTFCLWVTSFSIPLATKLNK